MERIAAKACLWFLNGFIVINQIFIYWEKIVIISLYVTFLCSLVLLVSHALQKFFCLDSWWISWLAWWWSCSVCLDSHPFFSTWNFKICFSNPNSWSWSLKISLVASDLVAYQIEVVSWVLPSFCCFMSSSGLLSNCSSTEQKTHSWGTLLGSRGIGVSD